tara:strand:- start:146 stop:355 length:210 start_codon:yes stop_codon:yes gene_type:complete
MNADFINLKDSEGSDEIFGIVSNIIPMIMFITYKYNGMSYHIEMPVTEANDHLCVGDEVEMQLFIMKDR